MADLQSIINALKGIGRFVPGQNGHADFTPKDQSRLPSSSPQPATLSAMNPTPPNYRPGSANMPLPSFGPSPKQVVSQGFQPLLPNGRPGIWHHDTKNDIWKAGPETVADIPFPNQAPLSYHPTGQLPPGTAQELQKDLAAIQGRNAPPPNTPVIVRTPTGGVPTQPIREPMPNPAILTSPTPTARVPLPQARPLFPGAFPGHGGKTAVPMPKPRPLR